MKRTFTLVATTAMAVIAFALIIGFATPADASCWICEPENGQQYAGTCVAVDAGGSICIEYDVSPWCQTSGSCYNNGNCLMCGSGCCAKGKDGKLHKCPQIKKSAFQLPNTEAPDSTTPKTNLPSSDADFKKQFLADLEAGKFDHGTVYVGSNSPIVKLIMGLPVNHWKSFDQHVCLQGCADKRAHSHTAANSQANKPQVILTIETKSGHTLKMRVIQEKPAAKTTGPTA